MRVPVNEDVIKEDASGAEEEKVEEQSPEEPEKHEEGENKNALVEEYLNLARVIQADFDNYRKRSLIQIENARQDGIASTAEILLPVLDALKKAKETVKDEKTLEGLNMLEKSIISGFEKVGIIKIPAIGLPLDPNVHNVLAVAKDETKEDGIILDEFQAGYKLNNKVIRCSQVLVNKL